MEIWIHVKLVFSLISDFLLFFGDTSQEGALVHLVATAGDAGEADEGGQGDANARAAPQNPGAGPIVPQIARAAALI